MLLNEPTLTHEEQQKAAERVLELMRQGMSSGQAIQQVANEIRAESASKKKTESIHLSILKCRGTVICDKGPDFWAFFV